MKTSLLCSFQKGLHVFLGKTWALLFGVKQRGRHFYPDLQGFCPDFQQNKTFGDALATPAAPSPTPLLFITVS